MSDTIDTAAIDDLDELRVRPTTKTALLQAQLDVAEAESALDDVIKKAHDVAGVTYKAIGEVLGISAGHARARAQRSLAQYRVTTVDPLEQPLP